MEFIAKFIKIDWNSYHKDKPIEHCINNINDNVSPIKVKVSVEEGIDYELFINTYHHANFAICFDEITLDAHPYIQPSLTNDLTLPMLEIFCEGGKHYWIQKQEKLKEEKNKPSYMQSDFNNHIGKTHIVYQSKGIKKIIKINIEESILDKDGQDLILREFKNEFYKLIFKENSLASDSINNHSNSSRNLNIPDLSRVDDIIKILSEIKKNPYLELGYQEKLMPIHRVKTATKTVIEYSQNPNRKFYTGKAFQESINNTVNGFTLYLTKNIITYLQGFAESLDSEKESLNTDIQFVTHTRSEIQQEIERQGLFDKSVLDGLIENQEQNTDNLVKREIKGRLTKGDYYYFFGNENIKFSKAIMEELKTENYLIVGYGKYITNTRGTTYFEFQYVEKLEILKHNRENLIENVVEMEQSALDEEKNRQEKINEDNKRLLEATIEKINRKIQELKDFCYYFEKMGTKTYVNKPSSKVFDYELRYSELLRKYNSLNVKRNLDVLKLKNFINNELFLSDIPKIYERWVLLKILFILIDKFGFKPMNDDWNMILADQLFNKNKNFANTIIQMKDGVVFYYEKILDNGKNPDYMLEFTDHNGNRKCLVMDAKFQNLDLFDMLTCLKDKKDYKEGRKDNWVYVICPMENLVKNSTSGMVWSKKAYYGESRLIEQSNNEFPKHRYGGIFLHPNVKIYSLNNIDNLQRLIGMFLQIHGWQKCIVCGSACEDEQNDKFKIRYCQNKQCKHECRITHCQSCHKDIIYKNGHYWTYQQLKLNDDNSINAYNIACPACGHYYVPILTDPPDDPDL